MKKLFTLLAGAFLAFSAEAQTTITTYYVIPPTNGCNGIWAVSYSAFSQVGMATYSMNPMGCVVISSTPVIGDTLYWSLCAAPCNVTMMNSIGGTFFCGTGTMTGTSSAESAHTIIESLYPNPSVSGGNIHLQLNRPLVNLSVKLETITGQSLPAEIFKSSETGIDIQLPQLASGNYFLRVIAEDGNSETLRLTVQN